ncbi:Non-specific lipid-transfer protein AP10 [Spatholobus suberectus]|nr:Non-specific lipid-transfer protein AP10 [Spatholobus suberectus]
MGEKKVLALVMFVMTYGLAVTTFTASQIPDTCNGYEPLLIKCVPYLVNPGFVISPTTHCCEGATYAFKKAMADKTGQGIRDICNCLRVAGPYLYFVQAKLVRLPQACGIRTSFSMLLCIFGN